MAIGSAKSISAFSDSLLGLPLVDRVPDAKPVWLFREQLKARGLVEMLFARLDE
jgi:hypothetical protein